MTSPAPLVECVPNVSEGRRAEVLARLAGAVERSRGVRLLDVSPDPDHNRTVLTFVGAADAVLDAALAVAAVAVQAIDLRAHTGVHPRIGALDVVPFVPLYGATMAACVALAERCAGLLAERFDVPAYLYAEAARDPARRSLAAVRRGGFEGLRDAIGSADRRPDAGPARVHPTAGACAVGARDVLIAMNVDLAGGDVRAAREIAGTVRASSGRPACPPDGGSSRRGPGLPAVQAMGVWLPLRGRAQVSMNLLDYRQTSMLAAFERVGAEAARRGLGIEAGELIGCAPRDALPPDPVVALKLRTLRPGQVLDPARLAGEMQGGG